MQSEGDPDETEEEAAARKKLKADKAAALVAKKRGNEHYSAKVGLNLRWPRDGRAIMFS